MKFNFNYKNPSGIRKIFICLFILLLPWMGFTKPKIFHYLDQTFTLYVNPAGTFFVFGPWGEDPVVVDRPVREAWGMVASFGAVGVYERREELRWVILDRDTGAKTSRGTLETLEPEMGLIDYVVVTAENQKALAKVVFEDGAFTVYQFDRFGRRKTLREGKIEKK